MPPAADLAQTPRGRVRFAPADPAGCSLFEEFFTAGCEVVSAPRPAA